MSRPVPPLFLGYIKCLISLLNEIFPRKYTCVEGNHTNADRDSSVGLKISKIKPVSFYNHPYSLSQLKAGFIISLGQNNHKFLASITSDYVEAAHRILKHGCELS